MALDLVTAVPEPAVVRGRPEPPAEVLVAVGGVVVAEAAALGAPPIPLVPLVPLVPPVVLVPRTMRVLVPVGPGCGSAPVEPAFRPGPAPRLSVRPGGAVPVPSAEDELAPAVFVPGLEARPGDDTGLARDGTVVRLPTAGRARGRTDTREGAVAFSQAARNRAAIAHPTGYGRGCRRVGRVHGCAGSRLRRTAQRAFRAFAVRFQYATRSRFR